MKRLRSGAIVSSLSVGIGCSQCVQANQRGSPIRHERIQQLRCSEPTSPTRSSRDEIIRSLRLKKAQNLHAARASSCQQPESKFTAEKQAAFECHKSMPDLKRSQPTVAKHVRILQLRCRELLSPQQLNASLVPANFPQRPMLARSSSESPIKYIRTQQLRCPLPVSPTCNSNHEIANILRTTKVHKVHAIRVFQSIDFTSHAEKENVYQKNIPSTKCDELSQATYIRTLQLRCPEPLSPHHLNASFRVRLFSPTA